jgi:hypothetical protein
MAGEIEEWKVRAYAEGVHHMARAFRNKLKDTVREENDRAKLIGVSRLGKMKGRAPTARLEPIIHSIPEHSRRWIAPGPWSFDCIVDSFEKAQQIHTPENEYMRQGAADYNAEVDLRIINAATGPALEGNVAGFTTVNFPAAQVIAAAGSGLTVKKIIQARAILGDVTNNEMETYGPYYFLYSPLDIMWIFNETRTTSTDFVPMRALMEGEPVNGFLGFNWRSVNQLPLGQSAANIRNCLAYAKAGLAFGSNMEKKERVGERNDITGHPIQASLYDEFGAVRIDEKLVLRVDVDTSVAVP